MSCRHLRELYDICRTHSLKLSSSDLIRIVCPECGISEQCPTLLCDEYEQQQREEASLAATSSHVESTKDREGRGNNP